MTCIVRSTERNKVPYPRDAREILTVHDSGILFGDSFSLITGGWKVGGYAQKLACFSTGKIDVVNRSHGV